MIISDDLGTCPNCGGDLPEDGNYNQKFCCDNCRLEWQREAWYRGAEAMKKNSKPKRKRVTPRWREMAEELRDVLEYESEDGTRPTLAETLESALEFAMSGGMSDG